ncbi:stage V sporulation protein R [Heliobacillus mobilis]|uniref:Stage V sporulation protein R n=1 Tax=Heliobacterium mobile TaxID=28064 RepID=A0A6I3SJ53_HELMO|nr:SpoVR family protein [Heliobacterium mobile]MTV48863.1 stage V sporulation protein R [Heliobacterium mobile]
MEKSQAIQDLERLEKSLPVIMDIAKGFGLDFYDMRFEVVPADVLYTFGAYGMPTRFSHWSFGKSFHRLKMSYDYNLSRIYELVINSSPCYAFLLEGNSPIQNELVAAHVLAHCDFFKNNAAFAGTSRFMVESMASSADRIREYEIRHGLDKVESFLDAVMAIQEHIDPHHGTVKDALPPKPKVQPDSAYEDLFSLERDHHSGQEAPSKASKTGTNDEKAKEPNRRLPERPQKDIMLFLMNHSPFLEDWQRDILSIMRDEMLYFWPQMRTKIMNEGWASFWHVRILREMDMNEEDAWEFAKMHAQVVQPSKTSLNPYYLGLKIFEDIDKRWNREKIFEVREIETDQSFLRNYLTKELVDEMDLYVYKKIGNQWQIVEKDWEKVRDEMVNRMTNGGIPVLYVDDGDYNRSGELLIRHAFESAELDIPYLERTLPHFYTLWGKTVNLETIIDGKKILFSFNGEKVQRKYL